jgi:hypothetical protein
MVLQLFESYNIVNFETIACCPSIASACSTIALLFFDQWNLRRFSSLKTVISHGIRQIGFLKPLLLIKFWIRKRFGSMCTARHATSQLAIIIIMRQGRRSLHDERGYRIRSTVSDRNS